MPKPRKPISRKKKKAETPEQDAALWQTVTKSVERLKPTDMLPEISDVPLEEMLLVDPQSSRRDVKRAVRAHIQPTPLPSPRPLPELTHADQPGLDKSTAKRMRRGQVKIEGRMDLHGLTQDEAHRALDTFLDAACHAGKREVLIITGKGTRADGSIGVLRQQVPRWLNSYPNRAKVVAFSYAAPKDGGEGALYVRLKKGN